MLIPVNGAMLEVRDEGDPQGAPITFITGITNDLSFWDGQAEALRDRFRLIRFDLRGHGQSEAPPGPYSFRLAMDDILAIWDRLGIERSHVMGLGMGGAVVMDLAASHPGRVTSLVGAGCRPTMDAELRQSWLDRADLVEAQGIEAIRDSTLTRWFSPEVARRHPDRVRLMDGMIDRTTAVGYAAWSRAFAEVELVDRLGDIVAPTLLITGSRDIFGGNPALVEETCARMPDCRMELLEDVGHLCNIEAPDRFNSALVGFLAERA